MTVIPPGPNNPYSFEPEDACLNCGHPLAIAVHSSDGCIHGWEWNGDGLPVVEGCPCNLMIAPSA